MAELPQDVRDALQEVNETYEAQLLEAAVTQDQEAFEQMSSEFGVSVAEGTDADREAGTELSEPLWDQFAAEAGSDVEEALAAVREVVDK